MSSPGSSEIERRFGQKAAEEWQLLLRHFQLGQGFAFMMLLVPDQEGAEVCASELERFLKAKDEELLHWRFINVQELYQLPGKLLEEPLPARTGAVWVAAVIPETAEDWAGWVDGWRYAVARLNERRDVLRACLRVPLLFVGAPWLKATVRDTAPDLWSVRTLIVTLPPANAKSEGPGKEPDRLDQAIWLQPKPLAQDAPDPELALRIVASLRGGRGGADAMIEALSRATHGLISHFEPEEAERTAREALALLEQQGDGTIPGSEASRTRRFELLLRIAEARNLKKDFRAALDHAREAVAAAEGIEWRREVVAAHLVQGISAMELSRAEEAEQALHQALDQLQEHESDCRGDTAMQLAGAFIDLKDYRGLEQASRLASAMLKKDGAAPNTLLLAGYCLGTALRAQGREEDTEEALRQSLLESTAASPIFYSMVEFSLADMLLDRSRFEEAEPLLRHALVLKEQVAAPLADRAEILCGLAQALYEQRKLSEAERTIHEGISSLDGTSGTVSIRARLLELSGKVLIKQDHCLEAERILRQSLDLLRQSGEPLRRRWRVSLWLATALIGQKRPGKAEGYLRQAMGLMDKDGVDAEVRREAEKTLASVLKMQGRHKEAERLLAQAVHPPDSSQTTRTKKRKKK